MFSFFSRFNRPHPILRQRRALALQDRLLKEERDRMREHLRHGGNLTVSSSPSSSQSREWSAPRRLSGALPGRNRVTPYPTRLGKERQRGRWLLLCVTILLLGAALLYRWLALQMH